MKLSVLILTHNRPKLFDRCVESVLQSTEHMDREILINNDSSDITERHDGVIYHYKASEDLSELYKYLFDQSTGEYIHFIEDDDYLIPDRYSKIELTKDIHYIEYMSMPLVKDIGLLHQRNLLQENRICEYIRDPKCFFDSLTTRYFQLSQIIFRKDLLTNFPKGNNINNDLTLFKNVASNAETIKYERGNMWVQTTDGNDNISFEHLNTDERFC